MTFMLVMVEVVRLVILYLGEHRFPRARGETVIDGRYTMATG